MPLYLQRCLSHTSWTGFFIAFATNTLPYLVEMLYLFHSFNGKTYIDQQKVFPSFWFRRWRPAFLIGSILYDVGILIYCLYTEDIFAILEIVRLLVEFYLWKDQAWLIKHWIPFFVQKEKEKLIFQRVICIACCYILVLCSTSSWQERNDIFFSVFYVVMSCIAIFCTIWHLFQGGVDNLHKYRYHWARNILFLAFVFGSILGTVGLIIGDGEGNNLQDTLKFHSVYCITYAAFECMISLLVHRFIVAFEELSWKHSNPIVPLSTLHRDEAMTTEAGNDLVHNSNMVACDNRDVPPSSMEVMTMENGMIVGTSHENHLEDTIDDIVACDDRDVPPSSIEVVAMENGMIVGTSHENHLEDTIDDIIPYNQIVRFPEEDGNDDRDLDAEQMSESSAGIILLGDNTRVDSSLSGSRRNALAFDGIIQTSTKLRGNILKHEIMMVKLRRHELVKIEFNKLFCILYQLMLWETLLWIAQMFLVLYLQSMNVPTFPQQNGYYCLSPLENTINSVQFVNDVVFARRS